MRQKCPNLLVILSRRTNISVQMVFSAYRIAKCARDLLTQYVHRPHNMCMCLKQP